MTKSSAFGMTTRFVGVMGVLLLGGCASMFMGGGSLVSANDPSREVLVDYRAEGAVPQGVSYHLVRTPKGMAIFEQSPDGSGTLFETRWTDGAGDHYAAWVRTSHAYEFVVPTDPSQPVQGYVYPKGSYKHQRIDGVARPVPVVEVGPVRTLHPISK